MGNDRKKHHLQLCYLSGFSVSFPGMKTVIPSFAQAFTWSKQRLCSNLDPLPHPRDRTIYLVTGSVLLLFALFMVSTLPVFPLLFLGGIGCFLLRCAVEVVVHSPEVGASENQASAQMVSMREFAKRLMDSNASCVVFVDSSDSEQSEPVAGKPKDPTDIH